MIQIRSNLFETNSSSTHAFVYDSLDIPNTITLNEKDKDIFWEYYTVYKENFINWLYMIGVKQVFVNEVLQEAKPCEEIPRMFNASCEYHSKIHNNDEAFKYALFGHLTAESHNDPEKTCKLEDLYWENPKFFMSEWHV